MSSLQGFFNFLAYGLNSSVRKTLRNEIFSKCGVCCAKSDGQQFFEMSKFTEELEDDILEEISLDSPKAQLD
ncbi:hypothetical protein CYMTET_18763 [Cymbomonas tetramitiformis]|uniref:Uncharacterized protein n=1 Tax=Cymbomonas tetramitiformis TaxID=36881 RepID=A0AAE0L5V6_9CHLO|nr:hypothetical protein CYMTET_18763 [Cymbomonas tetramitiformis]